MFGVRRAGREDLDALTAVLSRAFRDDPVARFLFPEEPHRTQYLVRFFSIQLRHVYLPRGEVYTTADRSGVAMWLAPGAVAQPSRDLLAMGELMALLGSRFFMTRRLARFLAEHHPAEPHYYLGTLGTEPSRQREGIGTRLLNHTLSQCDIKRLPAYLECSTETALRLYERLGFVLDAEVHTPMDGPRLWLMRRRPRPQGSGEP